MDIRTGHLVDKSLLPDLPNKDEYLPVPEGLKEEAIAALADKKETMIDLKGASGLAQWAKTEREKKEFRKTKRKFQKQSRKGNWK